jgi:hypothetical protein
MKVIKDYIENGIIKEAFQAQMNLKIWNDIGENVQALSKLNEEKKQLFAYLQHSAQSQMVLRTARIFDKKKNYPTRSLDALFKEIEKLDLSEIEINNPRGLKEYLISLDCFEKFNPISTKAKDFLVPFITYCKNDLLENSMKEDITMIQMLRDKYIAHNEAIVASTTFDPNIIKRLTDLAVNISIVIERCLIIDSMYLIDESVDRNVYFVKKLIKDNLK